MKIGLQMYTLRTVMTDDFPGKLRRVAEMGYDGVEFAGYGGMQPKDLSRLLTDLGLAGMSSHVQFPELESDLDRVMEDAQTLGLQYITCPSVPKERRQTKDDFARLADLFNQVGAHVEEAGMQFAYHNHNHEFVSFDGTYGLDYLFSHTDPKQVQTELDLYWIEFAGENAVRYIDRYRGRCDLLHVKDMATDGDGRYDVEVGQGSLPWTEVFASAQAAGTVWYIVEQDHCRNEPFASVQTSLTYLQQHANQPTNNS